VRKGSTIFFHTLTSGTLTATEYADGNIALSFPSTPVRAVDCTEVDIHQLVAAFRIQAEDILFTGRSLYDLLVEVTGLAFDSIASIDYGLLEHFGDRGVIVTCQGGGDQDRSRHCHFRSRCFFPR
jgi:hypothetical protein